VAWTVVFYSNADGEEPAREYILGLPPKQRAKLLWSIGLLESLGTALGMPHARHLGGGLWELRTTFGGDIFRSLYITWTNDRFVILHVFQKKTQKTPVQDLQTAERRRADWLARHEE
jgi:phage-related protein